CDDRATARRACSPTRRDPPLAVRQSPNRHHRNTAHGVHSLPMRIAVVADSHLAPNAHAFNRNWGAVADFVRASDIDVTVHLGDVTVDGLADAEQFGYVRRMTFAWPTPMRYLPGNHDIGDNPPGPGVAPEHALDPGRLSDFRAALGPDYWVFAADGWRVIGLDAQLFGSDSAAETAQWAWLSD